MNRIDQFKFLAGRLSGVMSVAGVDVPRGRALEAVAAPYDVAWAGLVRQPDRPLLPERVRRQRVQDRLQQLGTDVPADLIPDEAMMPVVDGVTASDVLHGLLPEPWRGLDVPVYDTAWFDVGKPVRIRLPDRTIYELGGRVLTDGDMARIRRAAGPFVEGRCGFANSFAVLYDGVDGELTLHASRDVVGMSTRMQGQGLLSQPLLALCGRDGAFLAPHARDVTRRALVAGADVHVLEWSGGITGAGAQPGPGLSGVRRVVADNTALQASLITPRDGVPLVVVVQALPLTLRADERTTAHIAALDGLIARGARVVLAMQSANLTVVPHMSYGPLLQRHEWVCVDVRDYLKPPS